jgi:predicted membrane-bound spermidine synthase
MILDSAYLVRKMPGVENKENTVQPLQRKSLLILSFVEGACVMVAELAGGKMLAPYYGTSLYVWASTLAITLGGLTIGYYLGGMFSDHPQAQRQKNLLIIIALAGVLVAVMPFWANFLMHHTLEMPFLPGLVLSQVLFLLPPVLCMGMVSPLLISLIAGTGNSGKAAGSVYAISTMGGVLATLFTGFWIVPLVGISLPCIVIGAVLFAINIIILWPGRMILAAGAIVLLLPAFYFINRPAASETFQLLYHTEGMMGQVKVIEFPMTTNGRSYRSRSMLVNHNWQTWVDAANPDLSFLYYTRFTRSFIKALPKGSRALLVGLGGGTVARQLEAAGVAYDAVEIDGRLPGLAQEYFGLKGTGNIVVDDGRHYINKCTNKYDLIIIDALLGENVPAHLLSLECFSRLKQLLTPQGHLFIEFDGVEDGTNGMAQRLLLHTLRTAGYGVQLFSSVPGKLDADVMYYASLHQHPDFGKIPVDSDSYYPYAGNLSQFKIALQQPVTEVLTDNNPALDYYLRDRMIRFRQDFLLKFNKDFAADHLDFFY